MPAPPPAAAESRQLFLEGRSGYYSPSPAPQCVYRHTQSDVDDVYVKRLLPTTHCTATTNTALTGGGGQQSFIKRIGLDQNSEYRSTVCI